MNFHSLYIVGTPIGNLSDISDRALSTLKSVSLIAAEDTRVTKKILSHFHIHTPLISYREEVHEQVIKKILNALDNGDVAYVTDAGTPGLSDPGAALVREVRKNGYRVVPIPGPSALAAFLSVSGLRGERFHFLGFPPQKKGRKKFFDNATAFSEPVIFFESPHRIIRTLDDISNAFGDDREIVIGRELTKMFEEIIFGKIKDVHEILRNKSARTLRGEYVIGIDRM